MPQHTNTSMIPLDQIKNLFDVRVELDNDRVLQFVGMYESHVDLPPVRVICLDSEDNKYAYIDGRTRGAALALMGRKEAEAVIVSSDKFSTGELYAEALKSNWGGSKPPSRADITHSIIRMLEAGETPATIRKELNFLPRGSLNAYIATAQGTLTKRKISVALDKISEGELTIEDAASASKIDVSHLRVALKGKNKGFRSRTAQAEHAHTLQLHILHSLQHANLSIGMKVSELLQEVEHGEMSPLLAEKVINSWFEHLRKATLRAADWRQRLKNITSKFNVQEGVG